MPDNPAPLVKSHRQKLISGETQIIRAYEADIASGSPTAYLELPGLQLPRIGSQLDESPSFQVVTVDISPLGGRTDKSIVSYVYSNRPYKAGGVATTANQPPNEYSLSVTPAGRDSVVKQITVVPYRTPVRNPDDPDADPEIKLAASFERSERTLRRARMKISYTVSGTADRLGLPNRFISLGDVKAIRDQQDVVHVIDGTPMLFNIATLSQTRRGFPGDDSNFGDRYAITYEWVTDSGVTVDLSLPAGWVTDPQIGPPGEKQPISNGAGQVFDAPDGGTYSGVVLPWVPAPADLAPLLPPLPTGPWFVPPFCRVEIVATSPAENVFVPDFVVVPEYRRIDALGWQTLPGIA